MAFPRLEDAAGWMESIDVLDGEYERAVTPDGRVVEITGVRDSPVSLRITTEREDIGLRERLMRSRARMGFASDVDDPVSVANELMRLENVRIFGNAHMMMLEKNSDEIARMLEDWLRRKGL